MGIVVYAERVKSAVKSASVNYQYWMDFPARPSTVGEFSINTLTGKLTLLKKAKGDVSGYGFARAQLKVKRLVEIQSEYPEKVVWSS